MKPTLNELFFKSKVKTFISAGITKPKFTDGDPDFIELVESKMMDWLIKNYPNETPTSDSIQFDLLNPKS